MANSSEIEPRSAERGEQKGPELKAAKAEVRRASKAEREQAEADLNRRGVEAKQTIEAEEKKSERKRVAPAEKSTAEKEKPAAVKATRARPKPHTKTEREQVFKTEMKQVQAQMKPAARTFSKVIHNKAVEKVSDGAQKTLFRPSALIGGAVLGLVLGLFVYLVALAYHYTIGSFEILVIFIAGGIVGVVVELVIKRVRT